MSELEHNGPGFISLTLTLQETRSIHWKFMNIPKIENISFKNEVIVKGAQMREYTPYKTCVFPRSGNFLVDSLLIVVPIFCVFVSLVLVLQLHYDVSYFRVLRYPNSRQYSPISVQ